MKASEALLLSEKSTVSKVEKELSRIFKAIENSALQGYTSVSTSDMMPSTKAKLEELGYTVKSEWSGQREDGHSYLKISWK